MAGNPFDFNRDGRWSTPERAFTHYGVSGMLGGDDDRPAGCGCLVVFLVLAIIALLVLAMM